jgi:hypothetical protein
MWEKHWTQPDKRRFSYISPSFYYLLKLVCENDRFWWEKWHAATGSFRNEKVPGQDAKILPSSEVLRSWHAGHASKNESFGFGSRVVRNVKARLWRIEKSIRCAIMKGQQLLKSTAEGYLWVWDKFYRVWYNRPIHKYKIEWADLGFWA